MSVRVVSYPEELDRVDYAPLLRYLGNDIAKAEREIVPVDTGALRSGIYADDPELRSIRVYSGRHVSRVTERGKVEADDPKVPLYIEFGTRHMKAQPYMRPALYRYRSG